MPPPIPSCSCLFEITHLRSIIHSHGFGTKVVVDVAAEPQIHNHVLNHLAISVPNVDAAVEWYGSIFGFKKIRSSKLEDRQANDQTPIFKIYGSSLQKVKIAFLSTGNGVGFEIFEFIDPPHQASNQSTKNNQNTSKFEDNFNYTAPGIFHMCITTPDVDDAVTRVLHKGGSQIGETIEAGHDAEGDMVKAAYVKDPWGTVLEVLSCGFEALMANRA